MRIHGVPHEQDRIELANSYYEKFKDFDQGGIFTKGSGFVIGTFQSAITGRTFTIFDQMQISGWGSRCNRAAQISVCSGYYNWTPDTWVAKANDAPDGAMPRYNYLYDIANLTYKQVSKDSNNTYGTEKIKNQILGGGYIIMYLKGAEAGHSGDSKYDRHWANSMHWVAILGYRMNGQNEEIFVSDSGHYNSGWVPIDEFNGGFDADGNYIDPMVDCVIHVNEKQ